MLDWPVLADNISLGKESDGTNSFFRREKEAMIVLDVPWQEIEAYLGKHIPEFKAGGIRVLPADKKRFFKIQYVPGDIIMSKGVYSDYAAVHLKGEVFVYDREPAMKKGSNAEHECWGRPGRFKAFIKRWLTQPLAGILSRRAGRAGKQAPNPADQLPTDQRPPDLDSPVAREFENVLSWGPPADANFIKRTHSQGKELPFFERMMGVTSALLNQQRSYTLVAGFGERNVELCEFYLVPRRILGEIYKHSKEFRDKYVHHFLMDELPRLLGESRLFRNTLYVDDLLDPKGLVLQLKGDEVLFETAASQQLRDEARKSVQAKASQQMRARLDGSCKRWLATLSTENLGAADLAQLVNELNTLLKREDLFPQPQMTAKARQGAPKPTENQIIKSNRRRLEEAYPGIIKETQPTQFLPTDLDDLKKLIEAIGAERFQLLVRPDPDLPENRVIYVQGDETDGLYLIISGQVQIDRAGPGREQPLLLNRLDRHGFFGLSCIDPGAKHSANASAVTEAHLLKLNGDVVRDALMTTYPAIAKKLKHEKARISGRDEQLNSGRRLPPATPPQDIASRLMVTTNLLLINMDKCTRCDQCVAGCAASHAGIPRFHRSNPDLRFGQWEVAKACMHCIDAPCQRVCPVGAITFLKSGAVEIHRSRCIGCEYCALACPFEVIEMAVSAPEEPLCVKREKPIATKCDLCLNEDHDPPCVVSCPYGAAQRDHPRELFPAIKSWADSVYSR